MNELATTTDAFLNGAIEIIQPAKGHRSGLDAMLLAGCIPDGAEGRLADFGAGSGVVGMAIAGRCPKMRVDLVEREKTSVDLAHRSLQLSANKGFAAQVSVIHADISAPAKRRREAGLVDESYDWIVANPPFNDASYRVSPNDGRSASHAMDDDLFNLWLRAVAAAARPVARLRLILRPQNLSGLLSAVSGRFGGIVVKPVYGLPGEPATRILVGGRKGSRAPLQILEPFCVHESGGGFTKQADAVFRGSGFIDLSATSG